MSYIETFLATLTEPQISRLIELGFELVKAAVSLISVVGAIGTGALLYFQKRNKAELTAKIDENTAVNNEQIRVSNGHNEKIAAMSEQIANAKPVIVQVVSDPSARPQNVNVVNDSAHPVPVQPNPAATP